MCRMVLMILAAVVALDAISPWGHRLSGVFGVLRYVASQGTTMVHGRARAFVRPQITKPHVISVFRAVRNGGRTIFASWQAQG